MRDQIEVKTFFLEITMSLGKIREIRDQSPFFLENINFCESLLRGPNFEYPSLAKTSEITLLFLSIQYPSTGSCLFFSARTWFIYSVLNNALCVVTECLRPFPTDHLPVFTDIQPSKL